MYIASELEERARDLRVRLIKIFTPQVTKAPFAEVSKFQRKLFVQREKGSIFNVFVSSEAVFKVKDGIYHEVPIDLSQGSNFSFG